MSVTHSSFRLFPFIALIGALTVFVLPAKAQHDPLCFQMFFPVVSAAPGDTVCMPLMVRDFDNILTSQFAVQWDEAALKFIDRGFSDSPLAEIAYSAFIGHVNIAWLDPMLGNITLPDSTVIMKFYFRIEPGNTGMQRLTIGDGSLEGGFETVQLETSVFGFNYLPLAQQFGGVYIGNTQPNTLAISSSCTRKATCENATGEASIVVEGGMPPYTYSWTGPANFTANTATIQSVKAGDYEFTVTDAIGDTLAGSIRVARDLSQITTSVTQQSAVCGQANGCASITAQGGIEPYTFHWPSGNSGLSENCMLAQGWYDILVSDANGCEGMVNFYIGDSINTNYSIHVSSVNGCNGDGFIEITSTAQISDMQFLWSTGDTTANIENLATGLYTVTITSPEGCIATEFVYVMDNPDYSWGLQIEGKCDSIGAQSGTVYLIFIPNNNPPFPCIVKWSNGTVHTIAQKPEGYILDSLVNMPSGIYGVSVTDLEGCSYHLTGWIDCASIPPLTTQPPAFYVKDEYLNAQNQVDSCIGVHARHFNAIQELSFSLNNNNGVIKNLRALGLPGLDLQDFTFSPEGNTLGVVWESATPVTLPQDAMLFEVCYSTSPYQYFGHVTFGNDLVPATLKDSTLQEQAFLGRSGNVIYQYFQDDEPVACDFGVIPPDCAADGKYRISLTPCNPEKPITVLLFENNGVTTQGSTSQLLFLSAGTYRFDLYQEFNHTNNFFIQTPSDIDENKCVWPGDTDNNGAANHHDLLYIGLAYNTAGTQRLGASEAWYGQASADWPEETNLINFKNIDANGDGIINAADTAVIVHNWTRVINPTIHNPFAAAQGMNGTESQSLIISADTLYEGQSAILPLVLGTQSAPLDSVYGFSFSVSYDPAFIKDNIRFAPGNSWFADNDKYLVLQKNFPEQQRLDVAITRTDGVPASGWGTIGNFFIIIEDNIFGDPNPSLPPDTSLKTLIYFTETQSINSSGNTGVLGETPSELVIKRTAVGVNSTPNLDKTIAIYPSPASNVLHIESHFTSIQKIVLSDMTGQIVGQFMGDTSHWQIPLQALPPGAYFARILSETGTTTKKFIIAR